MKKKMIAAALLTVFAATTWANSSADAVAAAKKIEQNFGAKVKSAKLNPQLDMYEVFVESGELIYVSKDTNYIFSGNVIDVASKQNMTRASIDELTRFLPKEIPANFVFSRPAAKAGKAQEVWVFTDPKCTFCHRLEPELDKMADVKVNYIPLPYQRSDNEVATILCAKDKMKSWKEAMENKVAGGANFTKSCMDTAVKIREFAQSKNVNGTPTMLRADGARLSGYTTAQEIIAFLNAGK